MRTDDRRLRRILVALPLAASFFAYALPPVMAGALADPHARQLDVLSRCLHKSETGPSTTQTKFVQSLYDLHRGVASCEASEQCAALSGGIQPSCIQGAWAHLPLEAARAVYRRIADIGGV